MYEYYKVMRQYHRHARPRPQTVVCSITVCNGCMREADARMNEAKFVGPIIKKKFFDKFAKCDICEGW